MALPKAFIGQLNSNGVLSTIYNMIISQEVFSENITLKGTLVEKFRVDGTLFGDTKLYYSTDVGLVTTFPNTAQTLLTKNPPKDPKVQAVTIDTFKQTAITVDGVKLKQAFASADIYGAFVSVTIQWLRDAYKVLNVTLINTFVGTTKAVAGDQNQTVDLEPEFAVASTTDEMALYTWKAQKIGERLANIIVDLNDALRSYNDYGHLRSYNPSDFMIVWNKKYSNMIKHVSLPLVFHKDDVMPKAMESEIINSRYFGVASTNTTTVAGERTLIDRVIKVGGVDTQFFPGDVLPTGTTVVAGTTYLPDEQIICKILHKKAIPFMSALLIETEFYNAKDLDRNHYLTWGYSEPTYLKEFPLITIEEA